MFFDKKILFLIGAVSIINSAAAAIIHTDDHVPSAAPSIKSAPVAAKFQSPIRIDANKSMEKDLPDIKFNYPKTLLFDLEFNGHTVQANVSEKDAAGKEQEASIELNGKEYELKQFHMHAPSEHVLGNKRYPLEWHFVHQADDGSRLVIGVFMDDGKETTAPYNGLIDQLASTMKKEEQHDFNKRSFGSCVLNPRALIPADQRCWRYDGSLTSAPYTPVYWCVVRAITTISPEDLETLFRAAHVNTRSTQELGDRDVSFDATIDPPKKTIAPTVILKHKAAAQRNKKQSKQRSRAKHPRKFSHRSTASQHLPQRSSIAAH